MRQIVMAFFSIVCFYDVTAQAPIIEKIEPIVNFPNDTIYISGSGFNNNPAQLNVWFDQVRGQVIASTEYSIKVVVPAQARYSNIEVVNLTSRLSTKSNQKFLPSFNSSNFSASRFTPAFSIPSTEELWEICGCDFNNDGKADLVSTKFFNPANNVLLLQNGSAPGSFTFAQKLLSLTFPSDHAACGDLDADGKPDLVITRGGATRNNILIFKNTGGIGLNFGAPINLFLDVGHFATRSVIRDLNMDGKPEVIVSNSFNNQIYIYFNQSSGGNVAFNTSPIKIAVKNASTTYGLDVQDLNGDKLPDVVINQFQTNDIFFLKNTSSSTISFADAEKIAVTGALNKITTADLNRDNLLDIITTSTLTNQTFVLFNQSTSTAFAFSPPVILSNENAPWGVDVSDIDGDLDPDIIVGNKNQTLINLFLHNGNFSSPGFIKVNITTTKPVRNVMVGDLNNDGKPDIAFTSFNSSTGVYSLDILENQNCFKPPILNPTPLYICAGQTIRLNSISAAQVNYTWKESNTTIKNGPEAFLDITTPGTYELTGTEPGCSPVTNSIAVIHSLDVAPPPNPSITEPNTPVCTGYPLKLSTPLVSNAVYQWSGPQGFTSSLREPTVTDITALHAGRYQLQISVGQCKSNVVTKMVDVANLNDLSIKSNSSNNTICEGSELMLSVNNMPGFSYSWKKDNVVIPLQTSTTLSVNAEGTYSAVIAHTTLGCTKESTPVSTIVLKAPTSAFASTSQACLKEDVTFMNRSQVDTRASAITTWIFGDGTTSNTKDPVHAFNIARNYTISLTTSYAGINGCGHTITSPITILNSLTPEIVATQNSFCPGESTTLTINGAFAAHEWSTGETTATIDISEAGTYLVNTIDASGCSARSQITITLKTAPVVRIEAAKTRVLPGENIQLQASGADTYIWESSETLDNLSKSNPVATPTVTTTYSVTGSESGGCSAMAEIIIEVDASQILISPAVAFSPNGDGANETWTISGIENYPDCLLSIFDGRGRRIYEKRGYSNDWNGTYNGKVVPDGTYFFVFGCSDKKPLTGSVLIFR